MTNAKIIENVAELTNMTNKDVKKVIDTLEELFKKELLSMKSDEEKIKILDISYSVTIVPETIGRNPKTAESVTVPSKKKLRMSKSADIKRILKVI